MRRNGSFLDQNFCLLLSLIDPCIILLVVIVVLHIFNIHEVLLIVLVGAGIRSLLENPKDDNCRHKSVENVAKENKANLADLKERVVLVIKA